MAIKLTNLQKISQERTETVYLYKDLHLDFSNKRTSSETTSDYVRSNDILVDYDKEAIINSLRSLFNTRPGQRFLFPEYGVDFSGFLFEPTSIELANIIKNKISNSITNYEPRVKVEHVQVTPDFDRGMYEIVIVVSMPIFNTTVSLNAEMNIKEQSFIIINTNKN